LQYQKKGIKRNSEALHDAMIQQLAKVRRHEAAHHLAKVHRHDTRQLIMGQKQTAFETMISEGLNVGMELCVPYQNHKISSVISIKVKRTAETMFVCRERERERS